MKTYRKGIKLIYILVYKVTRKTPYQQAPTEVTETQVPAQPLPPAAPSQPIAATPSVETTTPEASVAPSIPATTSQLEVAAVSPPHPTVLPPGAKPKQCRVDGCTNQAHDPSTLFFFADNGFGWMVSREYLCESHSENMHQGELDRLYARTRLAYLSKVRMEKNTKTQRAPQKPKTK